MRPFAKFLPWLSLAACAADPIRSVPLDERVALEVPVATNHVTTLSFPGPITAIDAAQVSADPKLPALFQLAHTHGSAFLSLRATTAKARANLNVRWNDRTYVFLLREDPDPVLALNLVPPPTPAPLPLPRLSPTRLLALLDTAKAYPLLHEQHPKAVAGIEHRRLPDAEQIERDHTIRLEEVFRFQEEDSLVFRVLLRNTSTNPFVYDPATLAMRVGPRVFPKSITDARGSVPPLGEETFYLAITGDPQGGRADLSPRNAFALVLPTQP